MKKSLLFALCFALVFSVFSTISFAGESYSGNYVVFGDSIAAGYGLDDSEFGSDKANEYVADRDSDAYVGIVARTLDFDLFNFAHSGDTTSDMLKVLKRSDVREKIAAADLVTVSIGGNDLIDMASTVLFQAFMHELGMSETNEEIDAMYATLEANLTEAMRTIISLNNGRGTIMLQTLYNPFKYNSSYTFNGMNAGNLIDIYIQKINQIYESIYSKVGGFVLTNVADALNADESSFYTIQEKPDFHPTPHGHELIAKTILASYAAENASTNPDETTQNSETTEPTVSEPTVSETTEPTPTLYTEESSSEHSAQVFTSYEIETQPPTETVITPTAEPEPSTAGTESSSEPEPSGSSVETEASTINESKESTEEPKPSEIPTGTEKEPSVSSNVTEGTPKSTSAEGTQKATGGCELSLGSGAAVVIITSIMGFAFVKKGK